MPISTGSEDEAGGKKGFKLNLWGNGPGNYSLWAWQPSIGFILQHAGVASTSISPSTSASIAPVPEPSTMTAGALLLLPFAASILRKVRRNS